MAALAILMAASPSARADEGETALSIYGGLASFAIDEEETTTGIGLGAGLDVERGLTESVWLRASGGGAIYRGRPTAFTAHATLGLTYAFDVLKYVPYAHLGGGATWIHADRTPGAPEADNQSSIEPLIEIGGGLDVLSDPDFSWGVQLRFESFVNRTALVTAGLRISWRWGFF